MAEPDLKGLLRTLEPAVLASPFGFAVRSGGSVPFATFAAMADDEGWPLVALNGAMQAAIGRTAIGRTAIGRTATWISCV